MSRLDFLGNFGGKKWLRRSSSKCWNSDFRVQQKWESGLIHMKVGISLESGKVRNR